MDQKAFLKSCQYQLNGHNKKTIKESLLEMANRVDSKWPSDHYGSGESINLFEDQLQSYLGKEACLFFPSGTMAQQIALRCWADKTKNKNIAMHLSCHLEQHEEMGYRILHDLNGITVGVLDKALSILDIQNIKEKIGAIILELPQRHSGGVLPEWADLVKISQWAKSNKIIIHLDGARLWECSEYYDRSHKEICELFDSVYVSFYKGLGAVGGAALLGPKELIDEAKIWQRRHGGNLYNLWPLGISAKQGYEEHLPKMPIYFKKAQEIFDVISEQSNINLKPKKLYTNMMHLSFNKGQKIVENAIYEVAKSSGVAIGSSLWKREFDDQPILELYVGNASLGIKLKIIKEAFELLNSKLK